MSHSFQSTARAALVAACAMLGVVVAGASQAADWRFPSFCQRTNCRTPAPPPQDASGTLDSFVVTLKSLELVSTTGKKAQILRRPLTVDFAQIVNLEAAVYGGLVPPGDYTSATAVIDYSQAKITADDGTGNEVPLQPMDANSNPLTGTVAVTLRLDRYRHLVVSARNAALLALDFDLAATNRVNVANGIVTVGKTMVADVVPTDNLWVRLNGGLGSVSSTEDNFVLNMPTTRVVNAAARGPITVELSPTTTYRIAGAFYTGTAGQVVLASLPNGAPVTATGSLHSDRKTLAAATILAGT
jgi:hypothetical protein